MKVLVESLIFLIIEDFLKDDIFWGPMMKALPPLI
jgi:hypothetical protein